MANEFIKAEVVVNAALGILEREVVLPSLVWRDAVSDFKGAKNDTVSIRLPAYVNSRKRALRGGAARTRDNLHQRKVDVTLTSDLYNDIPVSDEELNLDIVDFGTGIINPVLAAIVRGYEDEVVTLMEGATYAVDMDFDVDDPHGSLVDAGTALNLASVPAAGRGFVCGANVAAAITKSDLIRNNNSAADVASAALKDAVVARVAGFTIVSAVALDPDEAFAFHKTAYALSSRAPSVPAGAPWGAVASAGGFAIRTVRVFDPDAVEDRLIADAWVGTNTVKDHGTINANGKFVPSIDPDLDGGTDLVFVRAVKLSIPAASA